MSHRPARRTWAAALGQQLRVARERAGLDRTQAADVLAGHDADYVDAIERGLLVPSLQQVYALADRYGATAEVCVWPRCAPVAAPRT